MHVRALAVISLLGVPSASTAAQEPRALHAVHGTVFDSVANAPLAGATVQMALRTGEGVPRTAVTDAKGAYRVDSLTPGEYVVGFDHEKLTAFGLETQLRAVALASADEMVDLAIPSSATIRSQRCGDFDPSTPGMIVGSLRAASTRGAVPGATLQVSWGAIATDSMRYRVVTDRRKATIEGDGTFFICRVPLEAALDLTARGAGYRDVEGPVVTVPSNGIARLDVLLADTDAKTGTALVRGRVERENGKVVSSGRVAIKALGREAAVQDGAFIFANIPAGSWVIEGRAMGAEPRYTLATAADTLPDMATLRVGDTPQRLDVVSVIGSPDRNTYKLQEVLQRKRLGGATVFLPGSPALRSATFTSDVFKEARGFTYEGPTKINGRRSALGGNRPCSGTGVFVNGLKQAEGFTGLDGLVPPDDVLAIEAYADINFAPVQYRGLGIGKLRGSDPAPCAVVLVWTKSP